MTKSNVKHFSYTKANGEKSDRTAYFIHGASDLNLCIDLSEFNSDERKYYERQLDLAKEAFFESIREVGLSGNIRTFKEDNLEVIDES